MIEGATYLQRSQPSPFFGYVSKLGETVTITCHLKDSDTDQLVLVKYSEYTGESTRSNVVPDER